MEEAYEVCSNEEGSKESGKNSFDDLDTANTVCAENNTEEAVSKSESEKLSDASNYCGVAEWCSQYNKEVIANQDGGLS